MAHAQGLVGTRVPQKLSQDIHKVCCGGTKDWEGAWGQVQLLDSRGLPEAGLSDKLEVLCSPMTMADAAQREATTETGHTQPGRHHDSQLRRN